MYRSPDVKRHNDLGNFSATSGFLRIHDNDWTTSQSGKRFRMGVLLYDGDHTTSFGDGLFAVPIGALWN